MNNLKELERCSFSIQKNNLAYKSANSSCYLRIFDVLASYFDLLYQYTHGSLGDVNFENYGGLICETVLSLQSKLEPKSNMS